jgi:Flp pilus assembly protein TadG
MVQMNAQNALRPNMHIFLSKLANLLSGFHRNRRGSVAILFALACVMLFVGMGAGLDLARAYQTRQKLAEVAMLSCQYATRPAIIQPVAASNSGTEERADYVSTVTSFVNTSLGAQKIPFTQTNSTPFTYANNGAAQVSLSATVPTTFMQVMHLNTIPVTVTANCFSMPSQVTTATGPYLVQESFETHVSTHLTWYLPDGTTKTFGSGGTIPKVTSFNANNIYTGSNGSKWVIMGYCVETDGVGQISSTAPDGSYTAELNCDNGSGTAGDSSISTKVYLNVGDYELRYFYRSRVAYNDYTPAYICGSQISDVSWANDSNPDYAAPVGGCGTNH